MQGVTPSGKLHCQICSSHPVFPNAGTLRKHQWKVHREQMMERRMKTFYANRPHLLAKKEAVMAANEAAKEAASKEVSPPQKAPAVKLANRSTTTTMGELMQSTLQVDSAKKQDVKGQFPCPVEGCDWVANSVAWFHRHLRRQHNIWTRKSPRMGPNAILRPDLDSRHYHPETAITRVEVNGKAPRQHLSEVALPAVEPASEPLDFNRMIAMKTQALIEIAHMIYTLKS